MKNDFIKGHILSARVIPQVNRALAEELKLRPDQKSLLLFTADADDIAYIAADYATKMCDVEVVYGESMYAGAANANSALAGDCIIMIAGPNPDEVRNALKFIEEMHENDELHFTSCNDDDSIFYLSYCVSRTGSYLSKINGIPEGAPLAYCVGAPLESVFGTDAAMKAADVQMVAFFGPPTNTNFSGAMFTGSQSACQAACTAYADAIQSVADCHIKA